MSIMGSYEKDWNDAVRTTQEMNETIVEYIGGIEVIKAFNQGKNSYAKFRDRVLANASYYYQWMKRCQFQMSLGYAIAPATLITILPFGWIFYRNGKSERGGFSHHHHSVDGNRGTAFGGNEFCRQSCEGRDDRGECRRHFKGGRTAARGKAGGTFWQ